MLPPTLGQPGQPGMVMGTTPGMVPSMPQGLGQPGPMGVPMGQPPTPPSGPAQGFEQKVLQDKLIIHDAVTLPQRIKITPMPGQPPPLGQPPQPPQPPQQPDAGGSPMAQPGTPFIAPGMPAQLGLPPTNPQAMLSNAEQLQQMQRRYAQPQGR